MNILNDKEILCFVKDINNVVDTFEDKLFMTSDGNVIEVVLKNARLFTCEYPNVGVVCNNVSFNTMTEFFNVPINFEWIRVTWFRTKWVFTTKTKIHDASCLNDVCTAGLSKRYTYLFARSTTSVVCVAKFVRIGCGLRRVSVLKNVYNRLRFNTINDLQKFDNDVLIFCPTKGWMTYDHTTQKQNDDVVSFEVSNTDAIGYVEQMNGKFRYTPMTTFERNIANAVNEASKSYFFNTSIKSISDIVKTIPSGVMKDNLLMYSKNCIK